jgi:hypothetical protein
MSKKMESFSFLLSLASEASSIVNSVFPEHNILSGKTLLSTRLSYNTCCHRSWVPLIVSLAMSCIPPLEIHWKWQDSENMKDLISYFATGGKGFILDDMGVLSLSYVYR